jgi:hypothetical protein
MGTYKNNPMLSINFSFEKAVQLLAESNNFYLVHINREGNYVYMNDHFLGRHSAYYQSGVIKPAYIALHPMTMSSVISPT